MTAVRIRAHITITATNGSLTRESTVTAWATAGPIPAGCPIDLHITGPVDHVQPGALHAIGCYLVDAPEVIVHVNTSVPNQVDAAVRNAIASEQRFRDEGYDMQARKERREELRAQVLDGCTPAELLTRGGE